MQRQQQVMYTQGMSGPPTFITVHTPPLMKLEASFKRAASHAIGAVMVVMAFMSFGAAIMAIVVYAGYYYCAEGFWCGSFFMIAGSMSIRAGKLPLRSKIKSAMTFSIISMAFAATQFGISLAGLIYNIDTQSQYIAYHCCWWGSCGTCLYNYPEMEAANGMLLAAACIQLIMGIAECYFCCQAIKCGEKVNHQTENVVVGGQNQTVIAITNGNQQMFSYPQPHLGGPQMFQQQFQQQFQQPPSYIAATSFPASANMYSN